MRHAQRIDRNRVGRHAEQKRRGLVLIAALVCLLVSTVIVGSMLKHAIRARRQLHTERDARQSELLLQAGIERATQQLAADPEFSGNTWELSAEEIVGRGSGRVTTKVERTANDPTYQIHVVAEYPLGRDFPIQRSQTFQISSDAI